MTKDELIGKGFEMALIYHESKYTPDDIEEITKLVSNYTERGIRQVWLASIFTSKYLPTVNYLRKRASTLIRMRYLKPDDARSTPRRDCSNCDDLGFTNCVGVICLCCCKAGTITQRTHDVRSIPTGLGSSLTDYERAIIRPDISDLVHSDAFVFSGIEKRRELIKAIL